MFGSLFKGRLGEKVTQFGLWQHLDEQVYRRFDDVIVPARLAARASQDADSFAQATAYNDAHPRAIFIANLGTFCCPRRRLTWWRLPATSTSAFVGLHGHA